MNLPSFLGPGVPIASPPIMHALLGGAAPLSSLPFRMERQQQTNWCWAATSKSVSTFYDHATHWTQCDVAATCLNKTCCQSPDPCNDPYFLDLALDVTGNLRSHAGGHLSMAAIKAEIDGGNPVCCHISWSRGGHFVAITGYDGANDDVEVQDPLRDTDVIPREEFTDGYMLGAGRWDYTYFTKA